MNRQEKELMVERLQSNLKRYQTSFLIGIKGLTVQEMQLLRRGVRSKDGELQVAKNTLLRRAVSENPELSHLVPYFRNQIAIVFANQAPEIAKVLFNAVKEYKRLELIAGALSDKPLSKIQIEQLAMLPTREVLLAQVAAGLKAPITGYVNVLNQLILRLLWVLSKIKEEKQ